MRRHWHGSKLRPAIWNATLTFAQPAVAAHGRDTQSDWLASLPETLDYTGEFGAELVLFLPFVNWLSQAGLLRGRRVQTYRGMRCFYDDLACAGIVEKTERRTAARSHVQPAWLPVKDEHRFRGPSPFHFYPDLRAKFATLPLLPTFDRAGRPLVVVHNKATSEWGEADPASRRFISVNGISMDALERIFAALKSTHTVVYIRHDRASLNDPGYSRDHQTPVPMDDGPVLDRHPEVLRFDRLLQEHRVAFGYDLNTFKNALYARCFRFITSQGGGAHHIAMFSSAVTAILHRRGPETEGAYQHGFYRWMCAPPPKLFICRDEDQLLSALPAMAGG